MTLEEFRQSTELMFMTFAPPKPTDRLRALYEFFKSEEPQTIKTASRQAAQFFERLPTIKAFGDLILSLKRKKSEESHGAPGCGWCMGSGVVIAEDEAKMTWAYHCCCTNAARYKNYPAWFGKHHLGKTLLYGKPKAVDKEVELISNVFEGSMVSEEMPF